MFRKISASDEVFKEKRILHHKFLSNFERYFKETSIKAGRITKSNSGKADSYARYLIRMLIIAEEHSGIMINNLYLFESYKLIDNLRRLPSYEDYNRKEGRFPNAAINSYLAFISTLLMDYERRIDEDVDRLSAGSDFWNIDESKVDLYRFEDSLLSSRPILREEKIDYLGSTSYPRKISEVIKAKELAHWQCEIDNSHETFLSGNNDKPYIEGHHLIPMAVQDLYKYSIDFAGNITCLCPNCHRKIHFAKKNEKMEMVSFLYEKKQHLYSEHAIDIKKDDLLIYYSLNI